MPLVRAELRPGPEAGRGHPSALNGRGRPCSLGGGRVMISPIELRIIPTAPGMAGVSSPPAPPAMSMKRGEAKQPGCAATGDAERRQTKISSKCQAPPVAAP